MILSRRRFVKSVTYFEVFMKIGIKSKLFTKVIALIILKNHITEKKARHNSQRLSSLLKYINDISCEILKIQNLLAEFQKVTIFCC